MAMSSISSTVPRIPQRLPETSAVEERSESKGQEAVETPESSASAARPAASLPSHLGQNINQTA